MNIVSTKGNGLTLSGRDYVMECAGGHFVLTFWHWSFTFKI